MCCSLHLPLIPRAKPTSPRCSTLFLWKDQTYYLKTLQVKQPKSDFNTKKEEAIIPFRLGAPVGSWEKKPGAILENKLPHLTRFIPEWNCFCGSVGSPIWYRLNEQLLKAVS